MGGKDKDNAETQRDAELVKESTAVTRLKKEGTARNGCPTRKRSIDLRKSKPMEMAK